MNARHRQSTYRWQPRRNHRVGAVTCAAALTTWLLPLTVAAGMLTAPSLEKELRSGGFVLLMRHARSPDALPTASAVESDNPTRERQLDAEGIASARELGQALRKLAIPIGQIYSSPAYRAQETIRLAGLHAPQIAMQLAEGPNGMQGNAGMTQVRWLRVAMAKAPPNGTNTLIVTHMPNIAGAFGSAAAHMSAGEMIVFKPSAGTPGYRIVGRITIAQWQRLASGSGS
jgi:phosphohistidine phosphatase SixA